MFLCCWFVNLDLSQVLWYIKLWQFGCAWGTCSNYGQYLEKFSRYAYKVGSKFWPASGRLWAMRIRHLFRVIASTWRTLVSLHVKHLSEVFTIFINALYKLLMLILSRFLCIDYTWENAIGLFGLHCEFLSVMFMY